MQIAKIILCNATATCLLFASPSLFVTGISTPEISATSTIVAVDNRAQRIDAYMQRIDAPLAGYGDAMIRAADHNGIEWSLLPALSIIESTGGKHACGANVFGWASCRRTFKNYDEAIATVARHLGGNATSTRAYYQNKSTSEKLYNYNGSIEKGYENKVMRVMRDIEKTPL